jgi:nucleoside-diphosphate-sugar epimerase
MRLLVTGANGFIGISLCAELLQQHFYVRAAMRELNSPIKNVATVKISAIDRETDWSEAVREIDTVIHLAARVHIMQDKVTNPLAEYRKVNVDGTLNLARQAAGAGVRRFLFISSIKVNGEATMEGYPYKPDDQPAPVDPYGISKREAEDALRRLAHETGMEVVIIRPPLVYGPGVKANFYTMMRLLDKRAPLPLGAVYNQRSLIALDNLIDLIVMCIEHPAAADQIFLAADGEDISTTELLQRIAAALGKKPRLIPVPMSLLQGGARLLGKQALAQRLCGSLQIDISKTRELLNWTPPLTLDQAIRKTACHYINSRSC